MLIREILDELGRKVFTLESGHSVSEAVDLMAEKDVSGLIVTEEGHPRGIFTERDVLLTYVRFKDKPFSRILLKDVMTTKLIVGRPEDGIPETISLMVQTDIRHLPVVEDGKITAVMYICDLVQHQVGTLAAELHYLEEYVDDLREAGRD